MTRKLAIEHQEHLGWTLSNPAEVPRRGVLFTNEHDARAWRGVFELAAAVGVEMRWNWFWYTQWNSFHLNLLEPPPSV